MMAQATQRQEASRNGSEPADSFSVAVPEITYSQAQLLAYAQDLARMYTTHKLIAQYLPVDLRRRIMRGGDHIVGERRYVTVLFADLVGFTRLSSQLDAEEAFSLINACFQRLTAHILKYGGIIDKFIGDGLMALFGAPIAQEDDPVRAVQAALDMQAEMQVFSHEMQPRLGVPLQLHIGIDSGEVVAGSVGVDGQLSYTVIGETVNLAARLNELAQPGHTYVGGAVFRQTEHLFDYEYLGEFEVKGIQGLVPVFSVQGEGKPQVPAQMARNIRFPFVGRAREKTQLAEMSECLPEGKGGVVVILGEAGLGKTRLVREWLATQKPVEMTVWWGTAHRFQQRIAHSLWRDLLRRALHLHSDGVSPAEVETRQTLLAGAGDRAPFILALAHNQVPESGSHLEPGTVQGQTVQAIRDLLVVQARRQPLILVVDNWQWADDPSRDLLLKLLSLADQYPILFCILSRSGIGGAQDTLEEIKAYVAHNLQRIELGPLWLADSWELLSSLMVADNLTDRAQAVILGRAQGNPFYMEELLRLMIADEIVEAEESSPAGMGARWRVVRPERLTALRTPPTLSGLAQANLDRLPGELQEILDYAAVIGPTFSLRLMQAVAAREREINSLPARLQELVAYGILESITSDGQTFVFRHAIIQETIYNAMLSHRRQALHWLAADALEILPDNEMQAGVELIANHFLQAGVPAKAVPYLIRAGRRAQARSAHRVAIEHYLAALDVLDHAPRYEGERLDLELSLGVAYSQLDQYDLATNHYKRALDLCRQPERQADICRMLGATYAAEGDWMSAGLWVEQALEHLADAGVSGTSVIRGQVYAACAQVDWNLGEHQRAELWAREGIAILEGARAHKGLATCYEVLSDIYAQFGKESLADDYASRAAAARQGRTTHHRSHTAVLFGPGR